MKYIKKFEKAPSEVSLDSPYLIKNNNDLPDDAKFKIGDYVDYVKLKNSKWNTRYILKYYYIDSIDKYECFIAFEDFYPNFVSKTWVYEDEIEKLSDEEVEQYELSKDLKKYNL